MLIYVKAQLRLSRGVTVTLIFPQSCANVSHVLKDKHKMYFMRHPFSGLLCKIRYGQFELKVTAQHEEDGDEISIETT